MDSQDNKRKWKNRDLLSSLDFALTGIFTAIKEEPYDTEIEETEYGCRENNQS